MAQRAVFMCRCHLWEAERASGRWLLAGVIFSAIYPFSGRVLRAHGHFIVCIRGPAAAGNPTNPSGDRVEWPILVTFPRPG